jgi:hypothetical protein
MIKPIETVYKGYRFRSRTEARWAIFFDWREVAWEYEREGYDLGGTYYLPDFWLSTINMWAEVKPDEFTPEERRKCELLCCHTGKPVLLLSGQPNNQPYQYVDGRGGVLEYWPGCFTNKAIGQNRLWWPGADYEYSWPEIDPAVCAARQARFEHGETPA